MNMDTVREWRNRKPFQPFVLRMTNGDASEVRHPEHVGLGKNRLIVVDPEADRASHFLLFQVNSIELLELP